MVRQILAAVALAALLLPMPEAALGATITLGWNADGIADGALDNWYAGIGASTTRWGDGSTSGTGGTKQSGSSNLPQVTDWVNSPLYRLLPSDSWQDLFGDGETKQDATWEMVFRPGDDAGNYMTGNYMLFNTGGNGDGTAWVLEGSVLEFRFQDNSTASQQVFLSVDLADFGPATDFYHVVGTADVAGQAAGIGQLFVNGVLVNGPETSSGSIADWDGGDAAGLGGYNFNIPGDGAYTADTFTGDIAIFNYYSDQILTSTEVMDAYLSLVPEPSTVVMLLGLGTVGLLGWLRRRRRS